jgi:predicted  nucleic acid-binding Zn-ribbon protein
MSQESEKFEALKKKRESLKDRKIRLEEKLKAAEESARKLVAEITEKGYDYKKLPETLRAKEEEASTLMQNFEEALHTADLALSSLEAKLQ